MPYIGNSPEHITTGQKVVYKYIATAGQTVFTGTDASSNPLTITSKDTIDVFYNGVRLINVDDYTRTTDQVTLIATSTVGDEIIIISIASFQDADHYTKLEVDGVVNTSIYTAPATLNTLNELAAAIGDDANHVTTMTTALAGKVDDAQVLTNVPTGAVFTDTVASKSSIEALGIAASSITGALPIIDGANLTGIDAVLKGTTFPSPVSAEGTLFYKTDTDILYISNGTQFNLVSNANPSTTGGTVTITALSESGTFSYNLGIDFADDVDTDAQLTYTLESGTMPTGCTLPTSGNSAFTGTASGVASNTNYTWQIKATDTSGGTATQNYQQTINNVAPTVTGGTVTITAVDEGGSASYDVDTDFTFGTGATFSAFSLQSGTLPGGLSLNTSTGVISGTMSDVSSTTAYTFTIRGTDTDGDTADQAYSWTITYIPPMTATGGTITTPTIDGVAYKVHTFLSSASGASGFVPNRAGTVDILMVAGGGGGGSHNGGGGGAGGYVYATSQSVTASNYTVIVGGGGGTTMDNDGTSGTNSSFSTLTTAIGGGGGAGASGNNGLSGGSGGGGSADGLGASGTSGQGYAGGNTSSAHGGGGGGSASIGVTGTGNNDASGVAGDGGAGTLNTINGSSLYWAGGGGAGGYGGGSSGHGGIGGGGGGGNRAGGTGGTGGGSALNSGGNGTSNNGPGGHAGVNTGSGGGAANSPSYSAGNGGSGIVIIRYTV